MNIPTTRWTLSSLYERPPPLYNYSYRLIKIPTTWWTPLPLDCSRFTVIEDEFYWYDDNQLSFITTILFSRRKCNHFVCWLFIFQSGQPSWYCANEADVAENVQRAFIMIISAKRQNFCIAYHTPNFNWSAERNSLQFSTSVPTLVKRFASVFLIVGKWKGSGLRIDGLSKLWLFTNHIFGNSPRQLHLSSDTSSMSLK